MIPHSQVHCFLRCGITPFACYYFKKKQGTTTLTVDLGSTLVVIKGVLATICALCGHEWLSDDTAEAIEHIVQEAKNEYQMVEVTQYREIA